MKRYKVECQTATGYKTLLVTNSLSEAKAAVGYYNANRSTVYDYAAKTIVYRNY